MTADMLSLFMAHEDCSESSVRVAVRISNRPGPYLTPSSVLCVSARTYDFSAANCCLNV